MPECHQRIGVPQPPKGRVSWTDQPYIEYRITDQVLIPEADQRQPQTSPTGRNPKPQTHYALYRGKSPANDTEQRFKALQENAMVDSVEGRAHFEQGQECYMPLIHSQKHNKPECVFRPEGGGFESAT